MCVSCGQELCKNCHECHNEECELYVAPSNTCEITKDAFQPVLAHHVVNTGVYHVYPPH